MSDHPPAPPSTADALKARAAELFTSWCAGDYDDDRVVSDLQQLVRDLLAHLSHLEGQCQEAERQWDDTRKSLDEMNAAMAEREQWRRGNHGYCVICNTTIWNTDGMIEDERGKMHPICPVKARAEAAEAKVQALEAREKRVREAANKWRAHVSDRPDDPRDDESFSILDEIDAALAPTTGQPQEGQS